MIYKISRFTGLGSLIFLIVYCIDSTQKWVLAVGIAFLAVALVTRAIAKRAPK